jgi:hypothetical protein
VPHPKRSHGASAAPPALRRALPLSRAIYLASHATQRFGVRPRLTWYDTHVTVDNLNDETRVNGKAIEMAV